MKILFSKVFVKEYKNLSPKIRKKVEDRMKLFSENKNNSQLNFHKLHGEYKGYFSINISGNIRVIFEYLDKETVLLVKIGTHSQLY